MVNNSFSGFQWAAIVSGFFLADNRYLGVNNKVIALY